MPDTTTPTPQGLDLEPVDDAVVQASVADELAAMRKLYQAIAPLDPASQKRVLTWLFARYGIEPREG